MKLADIAIRALKPPAAGAEIYYDDDLPCFGVRVSMAGTKSFILTQADASTQNDREGSISITASASGFGAFGAQWLAFTIPCQRFIVHLATNDA